MHSTYHQVITFDSGVNTEKTVIALENAVSDIIDMRNVESFSLLATTTGGAGHDGSPVVVQSILSLADGSWAENGNTYAFDTMSFTVVAESARLSADYLRKTIGALTSDASGVPIAGIKFKCTNSAAAHPVTFSFKIVLKLRR